MGFQITNITDDASQRHVLLVDDEEITLTLRFHAVSQHWTFDVSWREVLRTGFMISLGCLHIRSLNWPFDFFCLATDGSGMAPFRLGDFIEGRCEFYIALQEEIEAPRSSQATFPALDRTLVTVRPLPETDLFFLYASDFDFAMNEDLPEA